ncbi:MAG: phosphoribosylformylglycinamidine synthase, partial [Phycisphaerae bacterium]|nr:phosphoribosylformylglycinamidine synthase [Phycisphaerae bacterium]
MTTTDPAPAKAVHRIEVHPTVVAGDPSGESVRRDAHAIGVDAASVSTAKIYLIQTDASDARLYESHTTIFADPVTEEVYTGAHPIDPDAAFIEVHPLPGVMDPVAASVRDALRDLYDIDADVVTGTRYELAGVSHADAKRVAERLLANPVVASIHTEPYHPDELPHGHDYTPTLTRVTLTTLSDDELEKLSRDAHLFLSLDEMRAIRDEYKRLDREPTDIELETLAQTWSEHCVHKTLKSTITYRGDSDSDPIDWTNRPGHVINDDGSVTINNLLKSTVAAATHELIAEGHADWCLSVFVDNAGIVAFDDDNAVCVKVETHNHPSAIEPYGGAATGIGGCIRDIIGTGLAAKPIASTDVFCVANPDIAEVPQSCIHPRQVLTQVVAGVRDYGNRMGIPTVNGAVAFDDRYVGNPLVFCGCIGVMPRGTDDALIRGEARPGDRIIALGGRTGRDGIHGATFSSAELTDTHADEFAHAVQIGNAIEEKRVLDAILRARDFTPDDNPSSLRASVPSCLFSAITDCGAGGFSSAIGEMGEKLGAEVHLDRAPLKYNGLSYTEIWISEAQERMVLAVPPENVDALRKICDEEHVEMADLGHFGTDGAELILNYGDLEVGRLPMAFVHDGLPMPVREASWPTAQNTAAASVVSREPTIREALLGLLAHPDIASKRFIIHQYDHEVQGGTAVRPLAGPMQRGPMDAAVVQPVAGSKQGLAIASGLATGVGDPARGGDPYLMALAAIDECVRNLVCVGADPDRIAILDNFCWPSCKKPENLASLVRACEGCYDGAKAYRTPFISGKDSLNNQFTTADGRTIEIPPTLLITGVGVVDDVSRVVTMDVKSPGSHLVHVQCRSAGGSDDLSAEYNALGGSSFVDLFGLPSAASDRIPARANGGPNLAKAVARVMNEGRVLAAHDISDGGLLCAIAEMLIAGHTPEHPLGCALPFDLYGEASLGYWFGERPSGYVLETNDPAALLA